MTKNSDPAEIYPYKPEMIFSYSKATLRNLVKEQISKKDTHS